MSLVRTKLRFLRCGYRRVRSARRRADRRGLEPGRAPGLQVAQALHRRRSPPTPEALKQMVNWMAKVRMNVLDCPIDYQHLHRTEWDNFREALIPELRKRGILIEVGGHGYPNFLPQEKYFAEHPEWFRDAGRQAYNGSARRLLDGSSGCCEYIRLQREELSPGSPGD